MDGESPDGKTTFVATDVEGSTRLWELDAGGMRRALLRHDEILSSAVAATGGRIFKHTGDGVYAVFERPESGVRAALDAQLQLSREPWTSSSPLKVRVAVLVGEAHRDGDDYRGQVLNRCGRYLAIGHGGQILLSAETADACRPYLDGEAVLEDLGEHLLRDLPDPEHIFRLVHPDLPAGPAVLRTVVASAHNLPEDLSSFVGRRAELAEVTRMIREHRVVTLVGAGGCGKTRLAVQAARAGLDHFRDGVWFVPLAHQSDPTLLVQSIGRKLGVVEQPDRAYIETIIDRLRIGSMLLMLDNCEHLLEACAAVATRLLEECPRLRILTTSREPLGIAGELIWRVSGLALPDSADTLRSADAVVLFAARAAEADPHFDHATHAAEVADLCRHLDGLPLAIELAAARLRSLTIADIGRHLQDRFSLLVGGTRTAAPRQRTLHDTVDWSYRLLDPAEQEAFAGLSVFVQGFGLAAAAVVLDIDSEAAAAELIGRLVDKSLVVADRSGGATRFSMLETIRSFAAEVLHVSGELPDLQGRHARHFLDVAENGDAHLRGPDQLRWLSRLEQDRGNLRAALSWAVEHRPEWAYRLACSLAWFWSLRGRWEEGRTRLQQILEVSVEDPRLAARARVCLAEIEVESGAPDPGTTAVIVEARGACRDLGEPGCLGRLLLAEAKLAGRHDRIDRVIDMVQSAAFTLDGAGEQWHAAAALLELGELRFFAAGTEAATPSFTGALAGFRALGDRWGTSGALKYLAEMASLRGRHADAMALIDESMLLARQMGDEGSLVGSTAAAELYRGRILSRVGDLDGARAALGTAIDIYESAGARLGLGWAKGCLGRVELESGDPTMARRLIRESHAQMQALEYAQGIAWAERLLAHLLLHDDDLDRADELARRSLASADFRGDRHAAAISLAMLGRIAVAAHRVPQAERFLRLALDALRRLGLVIHLPGVLECLAGLEMLRDGFTAAVEYLEEADRIRTETGSPAPECGSDSLEALRSALAEHAG
jgi:predicted ATPase/class 3 adenylate cyclase